MRANVRCVAVVVKGARAEQIGTVETVVVPCGWKGERHGGNRNLGPLPGDEFYAELRRRMTELPCPRCGGRVDVIPGRWTAG